MFQGKNWPSRPTRKGQVRIGYLSLTSYISQSRIFTINCWALSDNKNVEATINQLNLEKNSSIKGPVSGSSRHLGQVSVGSKDCSCFHPKKKKVLNFNFFRILKV